MLLWLVVDAIEKIELDTARTDLPFTANRAEEVERAQFLRVNVNGSGIVAWVFQFATSRHTPWRLHAALRANFFHSAIDLSFRGGLRVLLRRDRPHFPVHPNLHCRKRLFYE
jgi:hypothetical protein